MFSSPFVAALMGAVALLGAAASSEGSSFACPADAAAAGSAMLQTAAGSLRAGGGAPSIEGRVATLDAELTSIANRVSIVMSTVGLQGAAALLANSGNLEHYKALMEHKADAKAVQDDVADLETRANDVKTKITEVENEVSGSQIGGAGLLEKLKVTSHGAGDSLSSRVTSLEEVVVSLKDRTKMMEEAVSKADLSGRVATLDAELTSLTSRVGILMSSVGLEAAAAFLAKAGSYERYTAILKGKHGTATIQDDVDALETDAQDVKTKITQVENAVAGSQIGGSLLEKSEIKLSSGEGWSLTSRVSSLEEVVASLQDRTKAMELQVAGSASKA
jgi:uncharacterized protein YlxW (UPF0749 family)